MRFSVRPYLMAGVALVAAGGIAVPSTVTPPSSHATRHETVALTAQTRGFDVLPTALITVRPPAPTDTANAIAPAQAPPATAAAQASALAFPGVGNAIIAGYDLIMPWVDWGVNTAVYAVGWIPVVNWFTPQIDIFYYDLIRPIITSATFNIAYWVGGQVSFGQGLTNFFNDTVNAGIGFVNAEIDWLLSFLPPLPPFFPLAAASEAALAIEGARTAISIPAEDAPVEAPVQDEQPPVEAPVETEPAPVEDEQPPAEIEPAPVPEPAPAPAPEPEPAADPEPETPQQPVTDEQDPDPSAPIVDEEDEEQPEPDPEPVKDDAEDADADKDDVADRDDADKDDADKDVADKNDEKPADKPGPED